MKLCKRPHSKLMYGVRFYQRWNTGIFSRMDPYVPIQLCVGSFRPQGPEWIPGQWHMDEFFLHCFRICPDSWTLEFWGHKGLGYLNHTMCELWLVQLPANDSGEIMRSRYMRPVHRLTKDMTTGGLTKALQEIQVLDIAL